MSGDETGEDEMTQSLNESFYYGCWREAGHFLWTTGGNTVYERSPALPSDFPVKLHVLDGGFLGVGRDQTEGLAVLSHVAEWTILSFWDRSVDERGGCNSNFIMRGRLDFTRAVDVAKEKFPSIWRRFKFEVRPSHS